MKPDEPGEFEDEGVGDDRDEKREKEEAECLPQANQRSDVTSLSTRN